LGNAYTYYSYEEYGRGYIGARSKSCIGDDEYKGSYKDKTFNPTHKIILNEYETMEEALADEILLHAYYDVAINPHFANRAKASTVKFSIAGTKDSPETVERKRQSHLGMIHSEEWRNNQSRGWTEAHRKRKGEQVRRSLTGRKKSDEHKAALSKSTSGRKYITDDKTTKAHNPSLPLPPGFRWGRAKGITKPKG